MELRQTTFGSLFILGLHSSSGLELCCPSVILRPVAIALLRPVCKTSKRKLTLCRFVHGVVRLRTLTVLVSLVLPLDAAYHCAGCVRAVR